MMARPEVLAFLHDSKENPDDDTPRLILADWLEDHGDERGLFVRLQCQRAKAEEMSVEETELLHRHRSGWLGHLVEKDIRTEFRRGLIEASGGTRKLLSKRLASLPVSEAFAWVDSLQLYDAGPGYLKQLASSAHWTLLSSLILSGTSYYADQLINPSTIGRSSGDWAPLASVALLSRLTELNLQSQDIGSDGAAVLVGLPDLSRLRFLSLRSNNLGDKGAIAFAQGRSLTGLTKLNLSSNRIRQEGFAALAQWRGLASVMSLSLDSNYPGPEGIKALAASRHLGNVTHLQLRAVEHSLPESYGPRAFGPAGAAALARARGLSRVQELGLCGNKIGLTGAEALAATKSFLALVSLDLSENAIGDAGVIALANSPLLAQLTSLNLRYNGIGDPGAEALARSPYASDRLDLTYRANWDTSAQAIQQLKALRCVCGCV
jgi:uncharacterized protein (TIGR02996 family)